MSGVPGELSVFIATLATDLRQSHHSTVSVRLLEYLLITSVLLTTAHDDWRRFPNAPDFSSPPLSTRTLSLPPSSPTASVVSTSFAASPSPTRRKLDLLEGHSEPFYAPSSPTHYSPRTLTRSRSRSSNYLRPANPLHAYAHSTPFSTPPSTPPIAYHDLPAIALPTRPLPSTPTSASLHAVHVPASAPAPQYSAHPISRSQSQSQARAGTGAGDAPPVPPIPPHFLAPPAPEEAPPSYAEIEWTVKVPQRRVSRREREREHGYLLA